MTSSGASLNLNKKSTSLEPRHWARSVLSRLLTARGAPIGASMSSSERVASFMVRADSEAELLRRTREAMQRLDVVDVDGRSIMRRDVYLKAL